VFRNFLTAEAILSVILAAVVGLIGLLVLSSGLLHDIWTFWFCFVIASSQYSLVKSVQPDSASPTHVSSMYVSVSCLSVLVAILAGAGPRSCFVHLRFQLVLELSRFTVGFLFNYSVQFNN